MVGMTHHPFRLRTTVAILTLVLLWANSATPVSAASLEHAAPGRVPDLLEKL